MHEEEPFKDFNPLKMNLQEKINLFFKILI